jgi:hypothetical protein
MIPISVLVKHASEVTTEEENTYYKIPHWFQITPDGNDIVFHGRMPDDLSEFICKAGLGQPNPQIKKPKE